MNKKITLLLGFIIGLCVFMSPSQAGSSTAEESALRRQTPSEEEAMEGAGNEGTAQTMVTVRVRSARVREEPSLDAAVEYGLSQGEIVSANFKRGVWLYVEREDGKRGWAHQSLFLESYENNNVTQKEIQVASTSMKPIIVETNHATSHKQAMEPKPSVLTEKTDPVRKEAYEHEPANIQKDLAQTQEEETKKDVGIDSDNHLMCLNFVDEDIQLVLSALAMERELNISTAHDVNGKISIHLYNVGLKEALEAITRAGGFSYSKKGDLYYVYKSEETEDPQAERVEMRIFELKYTSLNKVQEILDAFPGMRTIKIHEPSRTIIVEDTPENIAKIEKIISYWEKRPRQVIIEAKILEVELTDDMSFGVNWEQVLGDVKIGTGGFSSATLPTTQPVSPVPPTGTGVFGNILTSAGTSHQFASALDALQTKTKVNTLSTPKIVALHGETAKVQVGGQQGYKVTTVNNGVSTETVEFIDTGTMLEIIPNIDEEGNILLYVQPSINSARIEEDGIPVVRTTTVTTRLLLKNGETAFIGGLIQDTRIDSHDQIPVLGSIPVLGTLFRRKSKNIGKSELVVLITPKILEPESVLVKQEDIDKTERIEESFKKEPLSTGKQLQEFLMPMD